MVRAAPRARAHAGRGDLGSMYAHGWGAVVQSHERANELYERACDKLAELANAQGAGVTYYHLKACILHEDCTELVDAMFGDT
jgi:TPR repeat protein